MTARRRLRRKLKLTRGRKKPYTTIGIRRISCASCGAKPCLHQWSCCAYGNRWLGVCKDCDLRLNEFLLLEFFKLPHARRLFRRYRDAV